MSDPQVFSKPLACFGAALSSATLATSVDAAVFDLTPTQFSFSSTNVSTVGISGAGFSFAFAFANDFGLGNNIYGLTSAYAGTGAGATKANFGVVASSINSITTGLAGGFKASLLASTTTLIGRLFIGFQTAAGNLGFIEFNFSSDSSATILSARGSDTAGEAVSKGGPVNPVPLPASLPILGAGMLALGATGLRRRRKERAAQAA